MLLKMWFDLLPLVLPFVSYKYFMVYIKIVFCITIVYWTVILFLYHCYYAPYTNKWFVQLFI